MQISRERVKQSFAKSARSYDEAAVLQKEILLRLIGKLKVLRTEPVERLLDVGSGTGLACESLSHMFGAETYYAYDFATPMLKLAQQRNPLISQHAVCGDASALPFQENTFDVIFSASTYQWCNDLEKVFVDSLQALNEQGLFVFSTFGPDTLKELRHCFAQVDNDIHVSSFVDMHVLGDSLLANGFYAPVMESEIITVEYSTPMQLLKDLQATGATNHLKHRSKGLMSQQRLKNMLSEYEKLKLNNGKYPASYEVIYGHGKKISTREVKHQDTNGWQPIQFR